jgi:hypothetical protein
MFQRYTNPSKYRELILLLSLLLLLATESFSQAIPPSRTVDWNLAGLRDTVSEPTMMINVNTFGAQGDGITINDIPVQNAIASAAGNPAVIFFPGGTYLFNSPLNLPSDIIIRGDSIVSTKLQFDLSGAGSNLINVTGSSSPAEYTLTADAQKDDTFLLITVSSGLSAGMYIKLFQDDDTLVTSSWAINSVAQIIQITRVNNDSVFLASPLRRDYLIADTARVKRLFPKMNVGFECFKIERLDSTAGQTSNFNFDIAVNCWIKGVESNRTNFAHVAAATSSNLHITGSYFHHSFGYGGGGRAYGVLLQFSSGEILVENNIFRNLRHSMILQAGANGNVFSYNYSREPYWNEGSFPVNSAGDMVLHGNYVFANLFEGNICQNIVIDNSHGINGPYNTFFRNRAVLYGLIMNASPPSNDQNFVGNEITNTGPFMGNYVLNGTGHFQYGNIVKGVLTPAGTSGTLQDSYYTSVKPWYFGSDPWPPIGPPQPYNTGTIPALNNNNSGNYTLCNDLQTGISKNVINNPDFFVYPNPTTGSFILKVEDFDTKGFSLRIFDSLGRLVYEKDIDQQKEILVELNEAPDIYIIVVGDGRNIGHQTLIIN